MNGPARSQRGDLPCRLIEQRHLGVPEAVDRLLAIANDENGGGRVGDALALSPRVHDQLDKAPLQTACVLKLIDQQVVVARLQFEAAARELLLPSQERDGLVEHAGEIEERVLVEQRFVLLAGNDEKPQDSASEQRVDRRLERLERVLDLRSQPG